MNAAFTFSSSADGLSLPGRRALGNGRRVSDRPGMDGAQRMERHRYHIRRLTPANRPLLRDLLGQLSEQTRQARYGAPTAFDGPRAEAEIARLLAQGARDLVLIAVAGWPGHRELVGAAELRCSSAAVSDAEIGVVIRDDWQGFGIGTRLLRKLCAHAQRQSIARIHCFTLAQNQQLRQSLTRFGPVTTAYIGDGMLDLILNLSAASDRLQASPTSH